MESGVKTLSPQKSPIQHKSPWGSPQTLATPCSLSAVMDEEFAKTLQEEEEQVFKDQQVPVKTTPSVDSGDSTTTGSDYMLAQLLQHEYDREHDRQVTVEEAHFNKHNKVKISFENFRSLPTSHLQQEDEDSEEDDDWVEDDYNPKKITPPQSGRKKGVSTGQVTKHDAVVCGRRNVQNMEMFPPTFPTGNLDNAQEPLRLSNKVYNVLKGHSQKEEKLAKRLHEKKEHSTQEQALDAKTRLMLFKLVDRGILTEINGCVSTGKEAAVYHANGGETEEGESIPSECAIKVFKTTLNKFFRRDEYIKDDYRFKHRFSKQNPRKIVKLWAEKEKYNLKRLNSKGILCPEVVLLKKHVLIMSFIGHDQCPAPKLKEAQLSPDQLSSAYLQCVQGMERMYKDCNLVHADLNEYNMLWYKGRIYYIDVSQAVEPSHPHGLEFLLRDCRNVTNFFTRKGVADVVKHHELFNRITGLDISAINDQEFIAQIRAHTQRQQLMDIMHDKCQPYPFDYFYEESERNRHTLTTAQCELNGRALEDKESDSSDSDND